MYTEPGIYQDPYDGLLYCFYSHSVFRSYSRSDDYTAIRLDSSNTKFTFKKTLSATIASSYYTQALPLPTLKNTSLNSSSSSHRGYLT